MWMRFTLLYGIYVLAWCTSVAPQSYFLLSLLCFFNSIKMYFPGWLVELYWVVSYPFLTLDHPSDFSKYNISIIPEDHLSFQNRIFSICSRPTWFPCIIVVVYYLPGFMSFYLVVHNLLVCFYLKDVFWNEVSNEVVVTWAHAYSDKFKEFYIN